MLNKTTEKEVRLICERNNEVSYERYGIEYKGEYTIALEELSLEFGCHWREVLSNEFDMSLVEFISEYWDSVNKRFDI